MSSADLLEDSFPHGSVDGYRDGCRGALCPAVISCRDVHRRYSGDFSFRKAIDAGATLEEILQRDREARSQARSRSVTPSRPHQETPAPAPRTASPTRRCELCGEARRTYHQEYVARRRAEGIPAEHHGTAYGYQLGCHDRDSCPSTPSCSDASIAEERRRRREAGIPAQPPRVDAAPVREHVRNLMSNGRSVKAIAADADVSLSGLKMLLYGRSGARKGEMPTKIDATKASQLLALV